MPKVKVSKKGKSKSTYLLMPKGKALGSLSFPFATKSVVSLRLPATGPGAGTELGHRATLELTALLSVCPSGRVMRAGGESSVDAWTAALAARLQLDSPLASRQPSTLPPGAAATHRPPHAGPGGPAVEVLAQPAAAAAFPQATPQLTPQLAGLAHASPPRPHPAPVHTGRLSPPAGVGERTGEGTGEAPALAHGAHAPTRGLQTQQALQTQQRQQQQQAATPPRASPLPSRPDSRPRAGSEGRGESLGLTLALTQLLS